MLARGIVQSALSRSDQLIIRKNYTEHLRNQDSSPEQYEMNYWPDRNLSGDNRFCQVPRGYREHSVLN